MGKCPICLSSVEENVANAFCLFCDRPFHLSHLQNWLKTRSDCPVCKERFPFDFMVNIRNMKEGVDNTFKVQNKPKKPKKKKKIEPIDKYELWLQTKTTGEDIDNMSDEELWERFGEKKDTQMYTYILVIGFLLPFIMIFIGVLW